MIEVIPTKSDDLLTSPPRPMPLLVDVRQAGAALGCGRTLIYQLMADGKLAMVKVGRLTRISVAELQAFVSRQTLQAHGDVEDGVIAKRIGAQSPRNLDDRGRGLRSARSSAAQRTRGTAVTGHGSPGDSPLITNENAFDGVRTSTRVVAVANQKGGVGRRPPRST